jgi:8-oxo-dGTP pyrophosphatase MutT (NUDIX family)
MTQELSAGGVVVRQSRGVLEFAIIRPRGRKVWTLPKGHLDLDELPERAAEREVHEETGLSVRFLAPLGEIRYAYRFRSRRIQKGVTFFLFQHTGGKIDHIAAEMRAEVDEARWLPFTEAEACLAYAGEKQMVSNAAQWLSDHPDGLA